MTQEGQTGPLNTKDVSPRMVLKRVMKSASPFLVHKQKKIRMENTSESLAVSLKSLPSVSARYDQLDHSSTPVSTKVEHSIQSTISPANRTNGNHSTAPSQQAEVPKLMIKLKPILPKATQSGFPFIFTNSDSDNSQSVMQFFDSDLLFHSQLIFPGPKSKPFRNPSRIEPGQRLRWKCNAHPCRSHCVFGLLTQRNQIRYRQVNVLDLFHQFNILFCPMFFFYCFESCDECQRVFHFGCLDPPLKKTPKQRGYSWHCAECDPSVRLFDLLLYRSLLKCRILGPKWLIGFQRQALRSSTSFFRTDNLLSELFWTERNKIYRVRLYG